MKTSPLSDPFALLGLPRSCYLSSELLETTFRKLAATHHPDHLAASPCSDVTLSEGEHDQQAGYRFQQLQEAVAILRNPASRLRYLSGLPLTTSTPLPPTAAALFPMIITALQTTDKLVAKYHATQGILARAVMMEALLENRTALAAAHTSLQEWLQLLEQQLQELDRHERERTPSRLLELAHSFTFAQRWDRQLSERKLTLTTLF